MTLHRKLLMGAGLLLIPVPLPTLAGDHHAGGPTAAEVEPGFPPSDSQDNAPPPEFSRSGDDRDDAGGAAAAEPHATAPKDGDVAGMPPTDSEDAVPPAAAPAGTDEDR